MFGKCWPWRQRKYRLTLVGLDNAGKTTWLYRLQSREDYKRTHPTIMSNLENVTHKNVQLSLWDLGGQDHHRALWKHWHKGSEGVVFAMDSSDRTPQRISDARRELFSLLEDDKLEGTVVLVLANKQDVRKAMSAQEVAEALQLDELPNERNWYVQPTSAWLGEGVAEGMDWLVANLNTGGAVMNTSRGGGKGRNYPEHHLSCALEWRAKLKEEEEQERAEQQEAERERERRAQEEETRRREERRREETLQREFAAAVPATRELQLSNPPATVSSTQFSHTSVTSAEEVQVKVEGVQAAPPIPTLSREQLTQQRQTREAQSSTIVRSDAGAPPAPPAPGAPGASQIPTLQTGTHIPTLTNAPPAAHGTASNSAVPVYDCTDGTPGGSLVGSKPAQGRTAAWRVAEGGHHVGGAGGGGMQTPMKGASVESHQMGGPGSVKRPTKPQLINAVLRHTPNDKKRREELIGQINRDEIVSMTELSSLGVDVETAGAGDPMLGDLYQSGREDLNAAMLQQRSADTSARESTSTVLQSTADASYASPPGMSKHNSQEGLMSASKEAGHRPVEWTSNLHHNVSYGDVDVAAHNLHSSIQQQMEMKKR